MTTPEGRVLTACDRLMRDAGFRCWRMPQGTRPGIARPSNGVPDRYYLHVGAGIAVWLEGKAPGGRLRGAQEAFRDLHQTARARSGAVPLWVCWSDAEECASWLRDWGFLAADGRFLQPDAGAW